MDVHEYFEDLFMSPVPRQIFLPPRFRDLARLSYVEWFNPMSSDGGIEAAYNSYMKTLVGKNKKWIDVKKIALEDVVSIIEMRGLLDTYFKAVKDILVGCSDDYVDKMAVFSFLLHLYVDDPKKRRIILKHGLKDISPARLHVLFNCAEKIKAILSPNVNFLKRNKWIPHEYKVGPGFSCQAIKEDIGKKEALKGLKLVDLLPSCRAPNTKKAAAHHAL